MIAGIILPTAGRIQIGGVDLVRQPLIAKRRLGYIPDRPFVYDKVTGAEFLRFVAALYDAQDASLERRIDELLDLFELTPWKNELTESYSHGMRQKLIIGSAFIHKPDVLVVDEPMVGLDPKAARILKDLFREYVQRGHTIMMSTHTLEVAETLCDRIAIIQGGKIRAMGTLAELRTGHAADEKLEEIFLALTGERAARAALDVLDA
jgi:ABC-2 type transport system ATP-binding protein